MTSLRHSIAPLALAFALGVGLGLGCVDFQGALNDCKDGGGPCAPGAGGGAGSCSAGQLACASGCVDPTQDSNNCGGCGHACDANEACFDSSCAGPTCADVSCGTGEVCINGGCVARSCVTVHCTAGSTCVDGACVPRSCGTSTCGEGSACLDAGCVDVGCLGATCADGGTCLAGRCDGLLPCSDHLKDPGESDVDCGGSCPACVGGKHCSAGSDCLSLVCGDAGVCGPSCVEGAKCQGNPNAPCRVGFSTCTDGLTTCVDGLNASDGVSCGANAVCAAGSCAACTAGQVCTTNHDACRVGSQDCSGRPVCVDGASRDAGGSCGIGQVCSPTGACIACAEGAPCTTNPSSPCKQGVVSCLGGVSACIDGTNAESGTACGVDRVCQAGTCITCSTGMVCFSNPQAPCTRGVTTCGATPGCADSTPVGAGSSCGIGQVCSGTGSCVACSTGAACTTNPGAPCKTGIVDCSTGSEKCLDLQSTPPGVTCGANKVCDGAGGCVACTAGQPCTGNPSICRLGVTSCSTGTSQCIDGAVKGAGTSCGSSEVCDGNGFCGACTAGMSCSSNPGTPCKKGVTSCSTGNTSCVDGANTSAGVSCGVNEVCTGGGSCVACQANLSCSSNPNPCFTGLTSCATGSQVCNNALQQPAGTTCGGNLVCNASGTCVTCMADVSCSTNPNPCKTGITSCASGASQCVNFADKAAGTSCGTDQVCNAGTCVSCVAGQSCTGNDNPCAQGITSCATGTQTCVNGAAKSPGTSCGTDKVCNGSAQCTTCVAGGTCGTNPGECYDGVVTCSTGVPTCINGSPKSPGEACTGGTCNGTGGCAAACTLPWGGTLASGLSVTAYSTTAAGCGTSCSMASEVRVCTNGTLSGSFTNQSCVNPTTCPCSLPWGGQVPHGQATTAYQAATSACGSSCVSESRVCNNGTLSGTYGNQACAPATMCSCSLPWGGTLADSQSVTAYSSAAPSCGSSCSAVAEVRTCSNGTLSGSFTNQSCVNPTACPCNLPWGGTLPDTQTVTAYSTVAPTCGSTCAGASETRTCTNGSLSGTFANQTCANPTMCACTLPWGGTLPDAQSVTAYQAASVACGSSCVSEVRTCTNSMLSGGYQNQMCSVTNGTKSLGMSCTLGCECATGVCSGFYPDGDGDTFGTGASKVTVCASAAGVAPSGFSNVNTDCCDTDALAFPGETLFYASTNACGSFDYDCSGGSTQQYPAAFAGCTFASICVDTGQGYPCNTSGFTPGWGSVAASNAYDTTAVVVPACGASGLLVKTCGSSAANTSCGLQTFCDFTASTTTQLCK